MRILILGLLFCINTQAFAQDESKHQIVGKWKYIGDDGGELIIHFTADKNFQVDFGGDGVFDTEGTFTIEGDQVTIAESAGECEGQEGVYSMTFEGSNLTLTQVSEACAGRAGEDGVQREFLKVD